MPEKKPKAKNTRGKGKARGGRGGGTPNAGQVPKVASGAPKPPKAKGTALINHEGALVDKALKQQQFLNMKISHFMLTFLHRQLFPSTSLALPGQGHILAESPPMPVYQLS